MLHHHKRDFSRVGVGHAGLDPVPRVHDRAAENDAGVSPLRVVEKPPGRGPHQGVRLQRDQRRRVPQQHRHQAQHGGDRTDRFQVSAL